MPGHVAVICPDNLNGGANRYSASNASNATHHSSGPMEIFVEVATADPSNVAPASDPASAVIEEPPQPPEQPQHYDESDMAAPWDYAAVVAPEYPGSGDGLIMH